jgi:hypothetical protein
MAKQPKGDPKVSVEVGGRTLSLHFNMGAVYDLMDATGLNMLTGIAPEEMQNPRNMMAFAWALAGGPDSGFDTPRDLSRVVEMSDLDALGAAVKEAVGAAGPLA